MIQAIVFLIVGEGWLLVPLVYGFLARVTTGPTSSPLGQFVTQAVAPRLAVEHRFVPGPPKRFAQGIRFGFSAMAASGWALGVPSVTYALLSLLVLAASLEAVPAVCLGCIADRYLWECEHCDDISERLQAAMASNVAATN